MITDVKINEALKKLYYERGYWGDKTIADVWDKVVGLAELELNEAYV